MTEEEQRLLQAQQNMITEYNAVFQQAQQAQQDAVQQHNYAIQEMTKAGHARYGQRAFDDNCIAMYQALGERGAEVTAYLGGRDKAPDIAVHLGRNPDRARRMRTLSAERIQAELAAVEAELSPHGRPNAIGNQPAYMHPSSQGGPVPDDVWAAGARSPFSFRGAWRSASPKP
jgi:hypothetical protein